MPDELEMARARARAREREVGGADPNASLHASYASGRLEKNVADKNAAEQMGWARANIGGAIDAVLGGAETVAAGVPGAKLAMSLGRSLFDTRRLPDIQRDINERTSDVPYASAIGRTAGAMVPLMTGPMATLSAAKGGAVLLGADKLLSNDPDASVGNRVAGAPIAALGGMLGGKAAEAVTTAVRPLFSPALGKAANFIKDKMRSADEALYGAAEQEGASALTTPQVQAALNSKTVKPFADIVRGTETFATADDATILRETYKLMSEQSIRRGAAIQGAPDFKAGTSLEKKEIDAAKKRLLDAADTVMPSFRAAVETHARIARVNNAFVMGANASRREMSNTSLAGEKQVRLSPAGVRRDIDKMTPAEAEAFTLGVLGRTKEFMTPNSSMINVFGIPRAVRGVYRAGPLLRAADRQSGATLPIAIERGLLAGIGSKMD